MAEHGGTPGPESRGRVVVAVVVSVLVTATAVGGVGAVAQLSDPDSSVVQELTNDTSNETTQFPPGTNESGVTNASALLEANERILGNETYTARLSVEGAPATVGNDSGIERNASAFTIAVEKGAAGTSVDILAAESSAEYWLTENATTTRSMHSDGNATAATYRFEENGTSVHGPGLESAPTSVIAPYVAALDYDYEGAVTRGNVTLHKFVATGVDQGVSAASGDGLPERIENTSATLLVSERGLITNFNATVQYGEDGSAETAQLNYSVDNVGNTTTTEPAWLEGHLPRFEASVIENGSVVALEYTDGPDLANGTQSPTGVLVSAPSGNAYATLNESLAPGDTVYLWNGDERGELNSSVNDPPTVDESATPFGGERAAVAVTRVQSKSAGNGSAGVVLLEVHVTNETAAANEQ